MKILPTPTRRNPALPRAPYPTPGVFRRPAAETLSTDLCLRVHTLASSLGWTITVDAFATASNAVTPRFFARFAETDTEA